VVLLESARRLRRAIAGLGRRMGVDVGLTSERRALAIEAAVRKGLLGSGAMDAEASLDSKPMGLFYDLDAWHANLDLVRAEACFGEPHFMHACAVKTNPVSWFLKQAKAEGFGAECASVSEVIHALKNDFDADKVVFDSPCKTLAEIKFALENGVHLNMDNLQELERVKTVIESRVEGAPIGLRINPLVGAGTIAAFSVSTGKSKFGVPLPAEGDQRETVLNAVLSCPWINCIHVHTGSGGMGLDQLVAGVRTAVRFAQEINENAGTRQIRIIDMGGGLAVDFTAENPLSGFPAYAAALRKEVPELFDPKTFDRVVTEFGAAMQIKFAFMASRVEYTKVADEYRIALIHAGSDIFMRACYCPDTFVSHRVFAYDADGKPKQETEDNVVAHDIAGPLCFAGDVVVRNVTLPALEVDDVVALADAGGNSLSIHTTHCSRQTPAVYAFSINADAEVSFELVLKGQTVEDTLTIWG